jgi:hypothetical protein
MTSLSHKSVKVSFPELFLDKFSIKNYSVLEMSNYTTVFHREKYGKYYELHSIYNMKFTIAPLNPEVVGLIRFPSWPSIFFKLARCGYTLRVASQTSYPYYFQYWSIQFPFYALLWIFKFCLVFIMVFGFSHFLCLLLYSHSH